MNIGLRQAAYAAEVKRWHIVQTLREQNIAEHQWLVAVIAAELAERSGIHAFRAMNVRHDLVMHALNHDIDEVMTGDAPTPAKETGLVWSHPAIPKSYALYRWGHDLVCLPEQNLIVGVVKLADLIEAAVFIGNNAGSIRAVGAKRSARSRMQEYATGMDQNLGPGSMAVTWTELADHLFHELTTMGTKDDYR